MKRLASFPLLFLTALFLTLTASAAESAIHSVTLDGNAVKVSVTAQSDGALWAAVYDESGAMTAAKSESVSGAAEARTVALSFDNVPSDAYAKAFLLDENFCPLTACGDTRNDKAPVYTEDVYAILYADGTLVFQHGDAPQPGREVRETYKVDMDKGYAEFFYPPWCDDGERDAKSLIETAEFADKIRPKSTACWFYQCSKLKEIRNLKNLDASDVAYTGFMFYDCRSLAALDLSAFNAANVESMYKMFYGCRSLTALDLSRFHTAHVKDMSWMFFGCSGLTALDLSGFHTAHVTSMKRMFSGCSGLPTLDLSAFDTANVTDMSFMFDNCAALTALDLSAFHTANVTDMSFMFDNCAALETLDAGAFDTANVTNMSSMFLNCSKLRSRIHNMIDI